MPYCSKDNDGHAPLCLLHAVYLVFGASGGIGSALVKRLASKGRASAVVLSDINDDKLQQLKRDFHGKGAAVDALAADAQSPEEVRAGGMLAAPC